MNHVRSGPGDLPASSEFFATPLREAVAMLRTGLDREDPVLLLTGPAGTGKTTVARRLLEELDPQRYALGGIFGSYGEGDALMSLVVQDLGVQPQRPGDAFLTLEQFFRRWDHAGREAVLLIDEAHALGADALRQLWQIAAPSAGGRVRLHVVLVAQQIPDAVTELTRLGSSLPIGTRCHLRALQAAETRQFVVNGTRGGGGIEQPAFSNEALDAIHERSGGVLRRINLLCDRIRMHLAMEWRGEVSAQLVAEVDAQLRGELYGPGLQVRQPVAIAVRHQTSAPLFAPHQGADRTGDGHAATRSSTLGPVFTIDSRPHPSAKTLSSPTAAGRVIAPTAAPAPRATSWRTQWPVLRQGLTTRLLAGFLMLVSFALLGLATPSFLRATMSTSTSHLAAEGARVHVSDTAIPHAEGPQSTVASSAASAAPLTAASPRPEAGPSQQPATMTDPGIAQATAPSQPAASALCSGPADTLGLCAAATAALPRARAEVADPAPVARRTELPSCMPERAALGLC